MASDMLGTAPSRPLSVSQVTAQVRLLLEERFARVWVEGEISNWTRHAASGHCYFALKDEGAVLSAVMFKGAFAQQKATFRDGDRVEARGRISVYDRRGQYQLIVDSMRPVGEGLLWQKFQELKARLEAEGLFDAERKRPLPPLPARVGIVTSPTGAAIRDMISVLGRRAPGVEILLWPARVQGEGAAAEVAKGVRSLANHCDVIIVGRGGGSLEELWEFNNEALARTIFTCPVPVISAVGHETDFSISDFVADLRAPTPSAAAEIVSAQYAGLLDRVTNLSRRLERDIDDRLRDARHRLRTCTTSWGLREPERLLKEAMQRTDDNTRRMELALDRMVRDTRSRILSARGALAGHDPGLILKKGYAIVRDVKNGRLITDAQKLKAGRHLRTQLATGDFRSVVVPEGDDLFEQ